MAEPDSKDQGNKVVITGFDMIIEQLEKYTKTSSIITINNDIGDYEEWDAARNGDEVVYGTESYQNKNFRQHLLNFIMGAEVTSIVLRSFTDVRDKNTGWPFKELRGYYITHNMDHGENRIIMNKLSAEEMFNASNTNYKDGKPIEPEESVIYCDDDHCIDSDQKPVIIVGFRSINKENNE